MYQKRNEDIDTRIDYFVKKAETLKKCYDFIDGQLKTITEIDNPVAVVQFFTKRSGRQSMPESTPSSLGEYGKSYTETVKRLNDGVIFAYQTMLESEREFLIKEINQLAKDQLKSEEDD